MITNETAHRLVIDGAGVPLVMTPFGSRILEPAMANSYDLAPWERLGLVAQRELEPAETSDAGLVALGLGFMGAVFFALLALVVWALSALLKLSAEPVVDGLLTGAAGFVVILLAGVFQLAGVRFSWYRSGGELVMRSLTFVATMLIGLGIPIVIGLGIDQRLHLPLTTYLQWAAISIAVIAPASFYFLFTRQRLESMRETFIREVMVLDPDVWTRQEAQLKYKTLMEDLYGTTGRRMYRYGIAMPVILATLLTASGWLLITSGSGDKLPSALREALAFGFLGAYFFSLQMTFRRYLRSDLSPKAYSQIIVRLLVTALLVIVAWMILSAGQEMNSTAEAILFVVAFVIGVLPETGVTLMRQYLQANPLTRRMTPGLEEIHSVTVLDGINLYDRARLLEEGIENVENLAHANLIELMLRTRIETSRLVDLFDQAILYLHLSQNNQPPDEAWSELRKYGIRTATDLEAAARQAEERGQDDLGALLGLLPSGNGQVSRLRTILDVMRDDEWMVSLRSWRQGFGHSKTVHDPADAFA